MDKSKTTVKRRQQVDSEGASCSDEMKTRNVSGLSRKDFIKQRISVKRKFLTSAILGVFCVLVPIVLIATDPMFIIAKYKFRLANGSILHEMLSSEMEGGRFKVYLFNITNADRFKSGEDEKLKLEEVGPFTYVEYRTHDLLEMDSEAQEMRYTPRMRSVFIPEESIGRPEDVRVTMPNIPMLEFRRQAHLMESGYHRLWTFATPKVPQMRSCSLKGEWNLVTNTGTQLKSATTTLRHSPYIVRSVFTLLARQLNSKPIVTMNADKYLWGYNDPVLSVAHKVAPGLIHFNSTGVMDRLYDKSTEYRMTLGTADDNKFGIKSVKVLRKMKVFDSEDLAESISTFNDTYEGMAYPPKVTTETPINIYRVGICKSFAMEFSGRKTSEYGSNAFIYKFSNKTLVNEKLCDSKGSCPFGILDMSSCFLGLPLGVTQGHFLGADPKLLNKIEGLSPDVDKHTSYIVIEPKIGLTLETSLSIQVNIVLGDIDYNSEVRRFSDMVLPIVHFKIKQPNLPEIAVRALKLMYITVPSALIIVEAVLFILGIGVLTYALKLYCCIWTLQDQDTKTCHITNVPLIRNK